MENENQAPNAEAQGNEEQGTPEVVQPDTLYANKYKSVTELETGYKNLQTKLGTHVGAPDEYTLNEGVESSDAYLSKLQEVGKELGLNNDGYNSMVEVYNAVNEAEEAEYKEAMQAEFAKLGDNGSTRIENINDWASANLEESEVAALNSLSQTADAVILIEKFIQMSKPQQTATDNQVQTKPSYDKDKLNQMRYAKDENGQRRMSNDPEYRKKVLALEAQYG